MQYMDYQTYYLINYGLIFLGVIITLVAQTFINISYSKYKKINNKNMITGSDMARYILDKNGLTNISVVRVAGELTDHYDPTSKVVRLSDSIYNGTSIASVAVAAHECGHAIQDKVGYIFMRIRASLVPIVNFSSFAGYIAILIGLIFGSSNLIWIGIYFELAILLFQIVTLPVEIDASKRGLKELTGSGKISSTEVSGSRTMLIAAASTYLASVATTLVEILRLVLLVGNRNRD